MTQPDSKSVELILQLFQRDIERHYGGRTVGLTLNGKQATAQLNRLLQQRFREGQEDCRKAGDPTNHVHYQESVNRLLEEAKVAELEKLGNAILTDGSSYDNIKPYVQRRLAELKKDKI